MPTHFKLISQHMVTSSHHKSLLAFWTNTDIFLFYFRKKSTSFFNFFFFCNSTIFGQIIFHSREGMFPFINQSLLIFFQFIDKQ